MLKLKTPWRDGTTHLVMSPLEFMQRMAALVHRPRLHLIRFHGVHARGPLQGDQFTMASAGRGSGVTRRAEEEQTLERTLTKLALVRRCVGRTATRASSNVCSTSLSGHSRRRRSQAPATACCQSA